VILIREIDLSVGSVYGIVGITFLGLESSNVSVLVSFIVAMLLALLIGLVNAVVVIRGKVPSMIVTLGGLFFYRGLIYVTTHGAVAGTPQAARENWLSQLFGAHWLRIENGIWEPPVCPRRGPGQRRVPRCSSQSDKSLGVLSLFALCRIVGGGNPCPKSFDQCFPRDRDGAAVYCRRSGRRYPPYRWERDHSWNHFGRFLFNCGSLRNDRAWCSAFLVHFVCRDRSSCRGDYQYPPGKEAENCLTIFSAVQIT
jgi:Branched-chain amino acid transport system / permease component